MTKPPCVEDIEAEAEAAIDLAWEKLKGTPKPTDFSALVEGFRRHRLHWMLITANDTLPVKAGRKKGKEKKSMKQLLTEPSSEFKI